MSIRTQARIAERAKEIAARRCRASHPRMAAIMGDFCTECGGYGVTVAYRETKEVGISLEQEEIDRIRRYVAGD